MINSQHVFIRSCEMRNSERRQVVDKYLAASSVGSYKTEWHIVMISAVCCFELFKY